MTADVILDPKPAPKVLFDAGRIVATRSVVDLLDRAGLPEGHLVPILGRHLTGDWGDQCPEDAEMNNFALDHGLRLFSSYQFAGETVWIITEADRSVTTFLLPDDY